ncbi:hypothetical protein HYALB_00003066 [Hymenoscyphus albidus]|uniref:Uncharacterized protein n=1 Tax=Hymenoscyphus albidus TaxID=595503 RepID=A0A9N9QAW2_9HELO|nr:hypothetical protein HYALB_00003066 [Hymenoscyphus albidus]
MEALILATLLTPITASPIPRFPPPILPRRATDPESGLANGAMDTGPSVSPFGWALVGVFGVGVLVIVGFTVRLRFWYKWFPRKPLASAGLRDVEGGRVGAAAAA